LLSNRDDQPSDQYLLYAEADGLKIHPQVETKALQNCSVKLTTRKNELSRWNPYGRKSSQTFWNWAWKGRIGWGSWSTIAFLWLIYASFHIQKGEFQKKTKKSISQTQITKEEGQEAHKEENFRSHSGGIRREWIRLSTRGWIGLSTRGWIGLSTRWARA
jgi:hypothetical protein